MEILFIGLEVSFLIFATLLLNFLLEIIWKHLSKFSWFEQNREKMTPLRQNISRVLLFTGGGLSVLTAVVSGILIYEGKQVRETQLSIVQSIPPQFWLNLVGGIAKTTILLILVKYLIPPLHRVLDFASDRARNFNEITANDENIADFFRLLKITINQLLWILAFILSARFLYVPATVLKYLYLALEAYVFLVMGLLTIKMISPVLEAIDILAKKHSKPDNILRFYEQLYPLVLLGKKCLEYIIYVGIATIILRKIDGLNWLSFYGAKIIQIIGIIFICNVAIEVCNTILEDLMLKSENLTELQKQRRLTIIPLFKSILKYLIYFTTGVSILKLIGIDPTPILAGAGIIGLAVGFGAQNLINDIVCGFFILFENYYLVGDFIEVSGASGFVESIDLRATRIRHPNGQLYILRNGEIKDIVNYSKQYIYAVVEVSVSYKSDLDIVYEVLEELGKELHEEHPEILEPTVVEGVEKFGESELVVRTITKVKPGKHYQIERKIRRRIKDVFDREEIEFYDADNVIILNNSDGTVEKS